MDYKKKTEEITKAVIIDGHEVPIKSQKFLSASMIKCEVGTNIPQGGDTGHGGRTYFMIEDLGCTDMRVDTHRGNGMEDNSSSKVEIVFAGDDEAFQFLSALKFAVNVLWEQIKLNGYGGETNE